MKINTTSIFTILLVGLILGVSCQDKFCKIESNLGSDNNELLTVNNNNLATKNKLLSEDLEIFPQMIVQIDSIDYVVNFEDFSFRELPERFLIFKDKAISKNRLFDLKQLTFRKDGTQWVCSYEGTNDCLGEKISDFIWYDPVFLSSEKIAAVSPYDYSPLSVLTWDLQSKKNTDKWLIPNYFLDSENIGGFKFIRGYPEQGLIFFLPAMGPITVVDSSSWEILNNSIKLDYPVEDLKFSSDGRLFTIYGPNHHQLWEISEKNISLVKEFKYKDSRIFHIAANKNLLGLLYSPGGGRSFIQVHEINTWKKIFEKEICSSFYEIGFSPDNRYILYAEECEDDIYLRIESLENGKTMRRTLLGPFSPSFRYIYPDSKLAEILLNMNSINNFD